MAINEAITSFDLQRMLLGDEPPLFLLEIAFRSIVIYAYTLFLLRWIGGRSIGQLSLVEFLLVIALARRSAMRCSTPEVPLVHCLVVITVVVLLDKALAFIVARYAGLEDVIEGKSVEIVKDGRISWHQMRSKDIGYDELFEQLRLRDVEHLGQVRAPIRDQRPALGLQGRQEVAKAGAFDRAALGRDRAGPIRSRRPTEKGEFACEKYGYVVAIAQQKLPACPGCEATTWHAAAKSSAMAE